MDPGSSDEHDQETIQRVAAATSSLIEALKDAYDDDSKLQVVTKYLQKCYNVADSTGPLKTGNNVVRVELGKDFQWINSKNPRPNLDEDAASNLIIFDFFTHCCINCIHSIEDLRKVYHDVTPTRPEPQDATAEGKFSCGFKIISIHSPKFTREKETESIRSSVERMSLDHTEVINDPQMILWNKFGVYCWPTIMIFGPNVDLKIGASGRPQLGPNLLFTLTGEGHEAILSLFTRAALAFFDNRIELTQVNRVLTTVREAGNSVEANANANNQEAVKKADQVDNHGASSSMLKFPGKVTAYHGLVCVSDSGNNRIIICDLSGEIQHIIGGTKSGYLDGDFNKAKFYNPQGTAFQSKTIVYVADTGNHCIRKIDLVNKTVSSLVSPHHVVGEHGQVLRSPWDLCFYGPQVLLAAAAGNHQIFGYFFEDVELFRVQHAAKCFALIAGSGREENRNNMYILKSSFAQPSGIAMIQGTEENDKTIYIADSESSSIRFINSSGRVMPLVGGSRDPWNLFCYGDEDGVSYDVKLQHPLGVCAGLESSKIFVTDTYNHKIKMIDVETKHCTTLIGDGIAKNQLGVFTGYVKPKRLGLAHPSSTNISKSSPLALLNEPGGLSIDTKNGFLYIADTNNHCIKVGHLHEKVVSELILRLPSSEENKKKSPVTQSKQYAGVHFNAHYEFNISKKVRNITLNIKIHKVPINFEGGNWKIICPVFSPNPTASGSLKMKENQNETSQQGQSQSHQTLEVICDEIPYVPWMREIYCEFNLALCGQSSCYKKTIKFLISLDCKKSSLDKSKKDKDKEKKKEVTESTSFDIDFEPHDETLFAERV